MKWESDKIAHYKFTFSFVNKTWIPFRPFAFVIILVVGLLKELIHDWLMGKGTPEVDDQIANWHGSWDGLLGNPRRFK